MIIPATYTGALLLMILSMLCWGSWANTFKLAGKWRFELFYYDYSLGVVLAAVIAAFTFGSMGEELSVQDNLLIAGKAQMAYAFLGGIVFNLANMLLVAAIAIAGLAVAFPVAIGLALVIGVVWSYAINPQGNWMLLTLGVVLVVGAIVLDALAYGRHAVDQKSLEAAATASSQAARAGQTKAAPKKKSGRAAQSTRKGLLICLISGVLMGSFYPIVEMSKREDIGLGPYSIAVLFAAGVFLSTFVFNLYFMNLPIQGEPVSFFEYFKGSPKQHLLGVVGGLIWCTGTIANFVAASAPKSIQVGPAISYAIGQGATMVSALWGLIVWREFAGASPRVRLLVGLMLLFFVGGLASLSLAPLFAH